MRKTGISKRDGEICRRLGEARELLGFSQKECARQIGLERSTFMNYEYRRTPLRYEVALRFCRQFIVSEEWLATGRFEAAHAAAEEAGICLRQGVKDLDRKILFRQCVDLLSEPLSLHVAPGTLFSVAYDSALRGRYRELVSEFLFLPRICLSEADAPELALNYLAAVNERFIIFLQNEALRRGLKPSAAWRVYARCVLECEDRVFTRMMRIEARALSADVSRAMSDPDAVIPFIGETRDPAQAAPVRASLVS
jgi:transcriptional regulator with XRE-family HTH domain